MAARSKNMPGLRLWDVCNSGGVAMKISSREIWNGLPAEDKLALVAGKHPEYEALHRIKTEAIGDAAFETFLTDYVINNGVGLVRPFDA